MAGILGFHAGFLTPSQALLSEFTVIANKGTRMVANLHHRFNIGGRLRSLRSELAIDVPIIFLTFLVCRMSHVFRHPDCPLFRFYSLQSTSRLRSLRSAGSRSNVSLSKLSSWNVLSGLGLGVFGPPADGRPNVRGESGRVLRWGEGWLEEIRDTLGWSMQKKDDVEIKRRVDLLVQIFVRPRSRSQALMDEQFALEA